MTPAQRLTLALGGDWHGSYGLARCVAHDDKRPSLSIRDGDKAPLVTCHAGCCDRRAIVDVLRRRGLWPHGDEAGGVAGDRRKTDGGHRALALKIWHDARAAGGTPVEAYLRSRGITEPIPPTLRWHSAAKHTPTGLYLDCMVAAVQAPDRKVIAIHRTFLTAAGRKAPVSDAKMGLAPYGAGAVRLAAPGETLGVAEGIETGFSAQQLSGVPTWCSLGAERLGKIDLAPIVRRVVIFSDRGAEAQAERARVAYERAGRAVEIRYPVVGKDFNDQLQAGSVAA